MEENKVIERLNKFFEGITLTVPLFPMAEGEGINPIDVKIRFTGTKELISIGEKKNFLTFNIEVVNSNNKKNDEIFKNTFHIMKELGKNKYSDEIEITTYSSQHINRAFIMKIESLVKDYIYYILGNTNVVATKLIDKTT